MSVLVDTSGPQLSFLERLPSELLHLVFGNVTSISRLCHPVCRTLRPHIEQIRYRLIWLHYWKFLQLCQSVEESPHLAAYVEGVILRPGDATEHQVEEEDEALVFGFFKSATNLKFMSLNTGHSQLRCRLMSLKFIAECYGSLERLELTFFTDSPSLLRHTRHLGSFKKLEELFIKVYDGRRGTLAIEDEMIAYEEEEEEEDFEVQHSQGIITHVKSLSLNGHVSGPDFPAFVARFRSLARLHLAVSNDPDYVDTSPILQAVDPTALTSLAIDDCYPRDWTKPDITVTHLVNVENLEVPSASCTPTFITSLAKLTKLKSLRFAPPDTPPFSHIQSLLHPRTRLPTVKNLSIGAPAEFKIEGGTRLNAGGDLDELRDSCGGDLDSVRPILPDWNDGWCLEEAREIVEMAKEVGVVLNDDLRIVISMTEEYAALRGLHELSLDARDVESSDDEYGRVRRDQI